jgi:hypothetical protein
MSGQANTSFSSLLVASERSCKTAGDCTDYLLKKLTESYAEEWECFDKKL